MINVIQGVDNITYDMPTIINLGNPLPEPVPAAYYSVRLVTPSLRCVLWYFFHAKDWSKTGGFIGRADTHRFDGESALQFIPCNGGHQDRHRPYAWAVVAHDEIHVCRTFSNTVNIDSQGHKLSISSKLPKGQDYMSLDFTSAQKGCVEKSIAMDRPKMIVWLCGDVQRIFNEHGVNLPWQQNHFIIRRKFGRETDGDIWNRPLRFLDNSCRVGMIKRSDYLDILEAGK